MSPWIVHLLPAFAVGSIIGLAIVVALSYWERYRRYGVFRLSLTTDAREAGQPIDAGRQAPKFGAYLIVRTIVLAGIAAASIFQHEYITAGICLLLIAAAFAVRRLRL